MWESTVAEQRRNNIHLVAYPTKEAYVAARMARDRTLPMPRLILHALQVNINAGRLPEPDANGPQFLRIPLNVLDTAR